MKQSENNKKDSTEEKRVLNGVVIVKAGSCSAMPLCLPVGFLFGVCLVSVACSSSHPAVSSTRHDASVVPIALPG